MNPQPQVRASDAVPMDKRVRTALAFMEAHFDEPLTLDDIARHVGVGRDHFLRLFHRDTGHTPIHALRVMRLTEAERLLSSSALSLKEIAARVGFAGIDLSHFARGFKA
jgi:transcriptional regulator GlxA family with amidase domain